eukprot:UN11619
MMSIIFIVAFIIIGTVNGGNFKIKAKTQMPAAKMKILCKHSGGTHVKDCWVTQTNDKCNVEYADDKCTELEVRFYWEEWGGIWVGVYPPSSQSYTSSEGSGQIRWTEDNSSNNKWTVTPASGSYINNAQCFKVTDAGSDFKINKKTDHTDCN